MTGAPLPVYLSIGLLFQVDVECFNDDLGQVQFFLQERQQFQLD